MTTEKPNNDPVISNASNECAKPENVSRASMHEVNTLGAEFADVHAAMLLGITSGQYRNIGLIKHQTINVCERGATSSTGKIFLHKCLDET